MSRSVVVPPFIVADGWDATFFWSQRDLAAYLEPWYVEEDYRAWDAHGRVLDLVAVPAESPRLRRDRSYVEARLHEPRVEADAECADYLRRWLVKVGGPEMPEDATLSDVLAQALIRGDIRD